MVVFNIKQGDSFTRTLTVYAQSNLDNRGEYKDAYTYQTDDLVLYNNVLYYSKTDSNKGNTPPDATNWGAPSVVDLSTSTFGGGLKHSHRDEATIVDFTNAFVTDGTDGKFTISLTGAQTAAFDFEECYFDVQITTGTTIKTYVSGKIVLEKEFD